MSLLALPRSILKRNSWERWSVQQPLKQESAMHMKIIRTKMRYFSKFYCHTVLKRSQGIRRFRLISFREFCLACIATQRHSVSDRVEHVAYYNYSMFPRVCSRPVMISATIEASMRICYVWYGSVVRPDSDNPSSAFSFFQLLSGALGDCFGSE